MYVYTVCVHQNIKNNIIHIHIEVKNALPNNQALRAGHINGTEVDSMLLEFLPACSCEYSCVHYDSCGGLLSWETHSWNLAAWQSLSDALCNWKPGLLVTLCHTQITEAVTVSKDAFLGFKAFRTVVLPVPMPRICILWENVHNIQHMQHNTSQHRTLMISNAIFSSRCWAQNRYCLDQRQQFEPGKSIQRPNLATQQVGSFASYRNIP